MRYFTSRRALNLGLLFGAGAAASFAHAVLDSSLHSAPYWSGWLLLVLVVGLALYRVRKMFPILPLGSSATWLQVHIYTGLFSCLVFLLHVGVQLPSGRFESTLAVIYALVFASGLGGLVVSRVFARRLTDRGSEVVFERIGLYRQRLQFEVQEIVSATSSETGAGPVWDFYASHLKTFFGGPRHVIQHLLGSNLSERRLAHTMEDYNRYLSDDERIAMRAIAERVERKNDLDYQHALQSVLKHWPLIHVPLTYSLLLLALVHVIVVHVY